MNYSKNIKYLDWRRCSRKKGLSEEFIEKNINKLDITKISAYQKLSEPFIIKNWDCLSHINIIRYQKLSEKFIAEKLDWSYLNNAFKRQDLSLIFIENAINKYPELKIGGIKNQNIFEYIVNKYPDRIAWNYFSTEQKMSKKFIVDNWKKLKSCIYDNTVIRFNYDFTQSTPMQMNIKDELFSMLCKKKTFKGQCIKIIFNKN